MVNDDESTDGYIIGAIQAEKVFIVNDDFVEAVHPHFLGLQHSRDSYWTET